MAIDRYTKAVLTAIALALAALAVQGAIKPATAQSEACGLVNHPCYVTNQPSDPLSTTQRQF